jgi:hypothetical protein
LYFLNNLSWYCTSFEDIRTFRVHEQIPVFHRKLTQTKIDIVRRKAALRPTYFPWRSGRFVFFILA